MFCTNRALIPAFSASRSWVKPRCSRKPARFFPNRIWCGQVLALRAGIGTVSPNPPPLNTRLAHVLTTFNSFAPFWAIFSPMFSCLNLMRKVFAKLKLQPCLRQVRQAQADEGNGQTVFIVTQPRWLFALQYLLARLTDDLANIYFQNVTNPQQGVESGVPRIRFQTANQRLAQSRFFRQDIAGNALPLPFLDKKPHHFSTDFVSMAVF